MAALDRTALRRKVETGIDSASNYDASAAINKYAQGAWGSISEGLNSQIRDLESADANTGRFNSGLYSQDENGIIRGGERDLSNAIASQSVNAARLTTDQQNEGYNRAADLYSLDEQDARDEAERKRRNKSGIGSAIGGLLGAGVGFLAGGPAGLSTGARLGSGAGGAIASRF